MLEEFERNLDERPQRVLRDRLNRMDYSNLQSPNSRSYVKKHHTPRTPLPKSNLLKATVLETDEAGNLAKLNAEKKSSVSSHIQVLADFISRWNIIPIMIDGTSYILSCVAIAIWGLLQIGYYIARLGLSRKVIVELKASSLIVILRVTAIWNIFYKFTIRIFSNAKKISSYSFFIIYTLKDHLLHRWPKIINSIEKSSGFSYRDFIDYSKNMLRRPIIIYRIKSSLICMSIIWLALVIVLTNQLRHNQISLPIVTDASPYLVDSQLNHDIAFLKEKMHALGEELQRKDEILKSITKDFKETQSVVKSIQLEQEMERFIFEDSINRLEETFQKTIEEKSSRPSDLFMSGPDYSLASAGALIDIEHTSPSFYPDSFFRDFFQINSGYGPQQVLDPSLEPGKCWGLKGILCICIYISISGANGFIEIVLPRIIQVTALVIEHAHPKKLFSGSINSAPKHIEVYGKVNDISIFLGFAEFDPLNNKAHIIEVIGKDLPLMDRITWKIIDNWGNPDWTCVYRLGVYGSEGF